MRKPLLLLFIGLCLVLFPFLDFAQIQVLESERSDSTSYSEGTFQDTIFIVYKGENNKSTITLFADFNNIDSLNFHWTKYDDKSKSFIALMNFDTVKNCSITYDDPTQNMNKYEGGYRVRVFNNDKGIDTTFTAWLWYQDFFINSISIYNSTCNIIELKADTSFHDLFIYFDLSIPENPPLNLTDKTIFEWTTDPESGLSYGAQPGFLAPVVPTTYTVNASDSYGFSRQRSITVDEDVFDSKGYPYLRAVKSNFNGIHGLEIEGQNEPSDTVNVEAPHGVWFFNESKNAEEFEWLFYNHMDWKTNVYDTILASSIFFEPTDSIYYKRPPRKAGSPDGYDVKLAVWGPVYNDNGDKCIDSVRKIDFVIVDTTQFPRQYKELPNVFTPGKDPHNYFYFVKKEGEDKPVKSIQAFSIKIYNRWGDKIYEYEDKDGSWHETGKDKPGWDGTTRVGTMAKPGVYYYTILATGWDGEEFKVGGYVHIFY